MLKDWRFWVIALATILIPGRFLWYICIHNWKAKDKPEDNWDHP